MAKHGNRESGGGTKPFDAGIERLPERRRRYSSSGRIRSAFTATPTAARALERELASAIEGEVGFDAGTRALFATDASNYRQVPIGVVFPRTVEEVETAVAIAHRHAAPILARGGGTSLAGQACNTALVIDFSRHIDRLLDLDAERRLARVEPGCILDTLRGAAEQHGLTFGPDPSTHTHNTLGGMIGNNSGGVHAVMSGLTVDNVESLEVLTYDGLRFTVGETSDEALERILAREDRVAEIYRRLLALRDAHAEQVRSGFPKLPRRVSGYSNLDWLLPENGFHVARALVGSEATCVLVLEATLNLVPSPAARVTAVLGFEDIYAAADAVPEVLEHNPLGLEGLDRSLVRNLKKKELHTDKIRLLPEGDGWLVVELGGAERDEAEAAGRRLTEAFDQRCVATRLLVSGEAQTDLRHLRESGLGATAFVPGHPETWEGWEDTAVPREVLGDYLRAFRRLLDKYGYDTVMYGHFGDGLVHCRINFDLGSEKGLATWRAFLDEAAELVTGYGGSLSGEHGDGQARGALLEAMYGPELVDVFREFKHIWDPDGRMNPGKVIDPYPITANLRVGPHYDPPKVETHFSYPEDEENFARATLRCVGVGKCRRLDLEGGVMCPSYVATREERHSTRGRARLLYEMLRQEPLTQGWRSPEVEAALDLCFACKACKSDCPVNVDMATYKAEFRSRHYARRLRPRAAYSMGLVHWWARAGAAVPRLANFAARAPGLSGVAKAVAGIAQERDMPRFAPQPFTRWFSKRAAPASGDARVVLWPDTFTNHFLPDTLVAATRVLEAAGFEVMLPSRPLCCARPLYDWGMLKLAKRQLGRILDDLRPQIEAGVPLVGLEPSCISAFRDELPALFPGNALAGDLSRQSFLFSEFLDAHAPQLEFSGPPARAVLQLHCHHHAVLDRGAELRLLERLNITPAAMPEGCCGMAGPLGFEAHKQTVSNAAAEHALLPALREAEEGTLVLADGFSCREQIRHFTGSLPPHIAEIAAQRLAPGGR